MEPLFAAAIIGGVAGIGLGVILVGVVYRCADWHYERSWRKTTRKDR